MRRTLIFLSVIACVFLQSRGGVIQDSIVVDCLSDHYKQQLKNFLPESFYLEDVSYNIDFIYDVKDLEYLTGLRNHITIQRKQLISACFYLKQIDRFEKIDLKIIQTFQGYSLEFKLIGNNMFSRLFISGTMRGKDFYKNSYLLDPSETFDEKKHQHSMQDIKQAFYDRGYCDSGVIDTVEEHKDTKTVSVYVALLKGEKFFIDEVVFHVEGVGVLSRIDIIKIEKEIQELCLKKLQYKQYSKELLKKVKSKIRLFLERNGFMNFDISLQETINTKKRSLSIKCNIILEQKKEFVFFGNHFFKRQELLDHLMMYGKSSWHFPNSIIIDELAQLYKSKGFWNVDISVREEKNRVFCVIQEGPRSVVSRVECKDNEHFSTNTLTKKNFKQFLGEKFFDKELLKRSIDQLIKFYKQHGFWDIKIVKDDFVKTDKQNTYTLILTLDEGKQRKIGTYNIETYADLLIQGPFVRAKKEYGTGFDPAIIHEQKQWLLRYFRGLGYSKVAAEYTLQEDNGLLNVIWKIILQEDAVKFGKVLITGNSAIKPSFLIKEVAFKQGDEWSKEKLEKTLKRLRELEVFETVQIYPSRDVDDDLQKPIFIKVIDADRYELRTRMGIQQIGHDLRFRSGFTYKVGGTFYVHNPFHFGDRLMLSGDFTRYYRNFTGAYQFPWLFGKSIRCQYKLYDTLYNQPVYIGSKCSLYQAGQRGFLWNMTKHFDKLTLSGTSGVEFMGIKEADQSELCNIIDYDKKLLDKKTAYLFLEPNILWQRLDNVLNPKQGHLSFVACKAMVDLDTKTSFVKLLVEHSFYVPLTESSTFAVRMRGGHVFNRNFNQLIPIERFYLGGANSVRGYMRDYCPPLGQLTNPIHDDRAGLPKEANNVWRYAPQGGRTMLNLNIDFRFPIYKSLGGVIFNDIGALFKDSLSNALKDGSDNILGGSGFGIRYDTPIGPMRFDVGIKWHRLFKNFESRWVWYLTLGQAF